MGIFDKLGGDKDFEPNCDLMDDGTYYCKPILKEGDKTYMAEVVVMPTQTGDFVLKKMHGSDKVLQHLQKHFEKLKLK